MWTLRNSIGEAAILRALRTIFSSLLRLCYCHGFAFSRIQQVLESAAVAEAKAHLVENNQKPTFGNIAELTGLSRRSISQIVDADSTAAATSRTVRALRAAECVSTWLAEHSDQGNAEGEIELPVSGVTVSFEALCQRVAPEICSDHLLRELIEYGAAEVFDDTQRNGARRVRLRRSETTTELDLAGSIVELGCIVGDAVEAFNRNLGANKPFQRIRPYTCTATVLAPNLRLIRRKLRERGESVQSGASEMLEPHNVPTCDVPEISEVDPGSLYAVRITFLSSIRPISIDRRAC